VLRDKGANMLRRFIAEGARKQTHLLSHQG
jgi:hypothetical protein